jgi:hypothetical protein
MFGKYLNGINKKNEKARIHAGVCALVCPIWNYQKDLV